MIFIWLEKSVNIKCTLEMTWYEKNINYSLSVKYFTMSEEITEKDNMNISKDV